ncbi:MAG TPA: cell wall-binding repeat-containing protein, partial [Desulfosporosinus sp.]|nr:cell wall-binding repeat-containing protein [Desulfosporosinus sp.]
VTDKTIVSQKILSSYANLLAEADALQREDRDSSYATAAKYYWTVMQGPSLDAGITQRAALGQQSALSKLIAEADKQLLEGSGPSSLSAAQYLVIVLQSSDLKASLADQANDSLLKAYVKLMAEADKLAQEGTDASKASAAKYYSMVQQGPVLDASLTARAKIGYDNNSVLKPTPTPIPIPTPIPTPTPMPIPTPTPIPTQVEVSVTRLAGIRAEDTAIKISQEGWANNSSSVVLLARVDRFQDALAAAPLAKKLKAPLLLTAPGKLDNLVLKELKRLGPGGKVYVIGGTGAIKTTVTDALETANFTFERIAGNTAADTAVAIARKIGPSTQVILASSTSFPDALSASAPAAALGIPILLTEKATLPASTQQLLEEFKVTKTFIVGGRFAISTAFDSVGGPLVAYGPQRLAGETKYDTMLKIVKQFNQDPKSIVIATGETFPDGLSGGAFAALKGSPMLLIPKEGINDDTLAYLASLKGKTTTTYILGGTGVICDNSKELIAGIFAK